MTIEETLASLVDRFNRHAQKNPATREELEGVERTIVIKITDDGSYAVDLVKGQLQNLRSGTPQKADVTIITDSITFDGLIKKEIGPMKAIVTRKLSIEGSLEDKLLFRKLL
jgi:putative sterol carrier protein